MARMQSLKPARKVWVGSLVGPLMILLSWIIETVGKTQIPSTVAVASTTLLTAIVAYIVPPADDDQVVS